MAAPGRSFKELKKGPEFLVTPVRLRDDLGQMYEVEMHGHLPQSALHRGDLMQLTTRPQKDPRLPVKLIQVVNLTTMQPLTPRIPTLWSHLGPALLLQAVLGAARVAALVACSSISDRRVDPSSNVPPGDLTLRCRLAPTGACATLDGSREVVCRGRGSRADQLHPGGPGEVPAQDPPEPGRVRAMLRESRFEFERPLTGMEIELNLIDDDADPAMRNAEVLGAIADPDFQTELGQFNIEINVPPRRLAGDENADLERTLRASLNNAEEHARTVGAHTVMIGILPTLRREHMTLDALSANPRYKLLNEQIFAARGEDLDIRIDGVDRLAVTTDTIAPESACTSTQFHLQVIAGAVRGVLERGPGDRRRAGGAGGQLAAAVRPGAVARDPDPAVRAGHRHPVGGDPGPGRTPAGVVRGALDHLRLRPVRGERALLPGPAADLRRRRPGRDPRARRDARR